MDVANVLDDAGRGAERAADRAVTVGLALLCLASGVTALGVCLALLAGAVFAPASDRVTPAGRPVVASVEAVGR